MMPMQNIAFQGLRAAVYTPAVSQGHVLFVHGGPGSHSAYFEQAIQELEPYKTEPLGWVVYDQRGCGRSDKAEGPLSHQRNIEDLAALTRHLQKEEGIDLKGVFGHSYGAWLAYDVFRLNPDLQLKLIMTGRSADMHLPRRRSLIMDLQILKRDQPEEYEEAQRILREHTGSLWKLSGPVRRLMNSTDGRKYYYWGNLDAMRWYEELQKRVDMPDDDEIFREVRATLFQDEGVRHEFDPAEISRPLLWIIGLHDFLMGGELIDPTDSLPIVRFDNSGHYPHFEEPKRFVHELRRFLET